MRKSEKKLCEECDKHPPVTYCRSCDQKLCSECDRRIHNKGKRASHIRKTLDETDHSITLGSRMRDQLVNTEVFSSDTLKISYTQNLDISSPNRKLGILKRIAAEYYMESALAGNLMHDLLIFKREAFERLQSEIGPLEKNEIDDLFNKLTDNDFLHVTARKFGDSKSLKYVSLCLKSISLEAIIWLILSIKNDCMKPSDKLILSRIKEYFLLKISVKDWNQAVDFFYHNPSCLRRYSEVFPRLIIKDTELLSKDTDKNGPNFIFELEGIDWNYEDYQDVDEDEPDWINFRNYINKFFEEEQALSNTKDSRQKMKKQKNTKNIQKWLSSVENNLSKTNNSILVNQSLKKLLIDQSISKAIPGGKNLS